MPVRDTPPMTSHGDIVRAYTEAWLAGDIDTVLDLYHPDLVLHYGGANPFAGDHVGKDAAITVLLAVQERTQRVPVQVLDIMESDIHAAAWVRERWIVDGAPLELERLLVYRTADDMLAECWLYDQDQALVDRVLSG